MRCPRCEMPGATKRSPHYCEPPPRRTHLHRDGSLAWSLCGAMIPDRARTTDTAAVTCRSCLRSMGVAVAGVA